MSHGLQVNAHYTWSRTRDIGTNSNGGSSQNPGVDPYTQIEADYGIADWDVPHRFVASYIYDVPFFKESRQRVSAATCSSGWQVGGHHDARERAAVRPDDSGRPGQYRHREPAAGSRRSDPVALVPEQSGGPGLDQLHRRQPRSRCRRSSPTATRRATCCAAPADIITDLSLSRTFRSREGALPDPRGHLQCLQPRGLRQSERRVRNGEFRADHIRRPNAAHGAGRQDHFQPISGGLRPPDPLTPSLAGAPCPAPLRRARPWRA